MYLIIEIWVMLDCFFYKKLIYIKEELEKVEVNVIDIKLLNELLFMMKNSILEIFLLFGF